jgi:hypothetical protein
VLASTANNSTNLLWPRPVNFTYTPDGDNVTVSPCDIKYIVESPGQSIVEEVINLYQIQAFGCSKTTQGKVSLNVVVKNTDQLLPSDVKQEHYTILLRNNSKW